MQDPANFDSLGLDAILAGWLCALREFSVDALVVLGPNPFGDITEREVVAVHPPIVSTAARALAESDDYGANWRMSESPMVAWQHIAKSDQQGTCRWRLLWLAHGFQTLVRVEFGLPAGRAFECFMLSSREITARAEAAAMVWSALNVWPQVKRAIAQARCNLSPRELECLLLAFRGLTASESADSMGCAVRTVNYHLANAMNKLRVDNKMAAIQRACWLGAV